MAVGNLSVTQPSRINITASSVKIEASATGWSLSSGSDGTPSTPSSGGTDTSTTTTASGTSYKDLRYSWDLSGDASDSSSKQVSSSYSKSCSLSKEGQKCSVTVKVTVTETKSTYTINQKWTRTKTEKKDDEGKGTGEYEYGEWTKSGGTTKSDEKPEDHTIGTKSQTVTFYTKPSGTFSSWSSAAAGVRISTTITAASQQSWVTRCKKIINWYNQEERSVSITQATQGGRITAAIYNSMVNAVRNNLGNTTCTTVSPGDKILAAHFTRLQSAVNI